MLSAGVYEYSYSVFMYIKQTNKMMGHFIDKKISLYIWFFSHDLQGVGGIYTESSSWLALEKCLDLSHPASSQAERGRWDIVQIHSMQ